MELFIKKGAKKLRIDTKDILKEVEDSFSEIRTLLQDPLIAEPFYHDFQYSFCWSSNAIEGNTLSLDDTVSFLEYDEVRSGHTFSEYEEAKRLNQAITNFLTYQEQEITKEWIQAVNGTILGSNHGGYRAKNVFIGTLIEATYYPPDFEKVPALMDSFLETVNFKEPSIEKIIRKIAVAHIEFERIHPFIDGNGRTGRLILNQCLVNNNLLPITIEPKSKYRQAFKLYDKSKDTSLMEYILYKGELDAINKVTQLAKKRDTQLECKSSKMTKKRIR